MGLNGVLVVDSELAKTRGESIQTGVLATNVAGFTSFYYRSSVTALGSSTGPQVSSIGWVTDQGNNVAVLDLGTVALQNGGVLPGRIALQIKVIPNSMGVIAQNTTIDVKIPPGWTTAPDGAVRWSAHNRGNDLIVQSILPINGSDIVRFYATPPSTPLHPFDVFHAQALNSSLAQADLVVKYPASTESTFPRTVYVSTPYPVFRGVPATFGVVFANGAENTTVTNVTIAIPGGYDLEHNRGLGAALFQTGWTVDTGDGAWTGWDARHASWSGSRAVAGLDATSWSVDVPITADPSVTTALDAGFRNLPSVNASFPNGFSMTSSRWGSVPGILRLDVPNESVDAGATPPRGNADGYPHDAGSSGSSFDLVGSTARATARTTASYGLSAASSDVVQLQSSVANSTFNVSSRLVPLGQGVTLAGDLQSVLTTLAQEGAADANLTLDVYAPPSLGCVPTASWTWSAGSLPVASVNDVAVWHAGGVAGDVVFAASSDGHVYEVLPGGASGWQAAAPATPTRLALQDGRLFVGDSAGGVTALDPAYGTALWSASVGAGGVTTLAANATTGRLLVAAGPTLARLDAATGARAAAATLDSAVAQAQDAADGGAFALTQGTIHRLGADLGVAHSAALHQGVGFAVGSAGVLTTRLAANANSQRETILLDPDTLDVLSATPDAKAVLLAGGGDATGDSVDDLVEAFEDATLRVVDGASGDEAWRYDPHGMGGSVGVPKPDPRLYNPADGRPVPVDCRALGSVGPLSLGNAGAATAACASVDPADLQLSPVLVRASGGRVAYAYASREGVGVLSLLDAQGRALWQKGGQSGSLPASATLGSYATAPALLAGGQDGTVAAFSDASGDALLSAKPAAGVGRFAFTLRVPMGGFFGAHLAVATLSWTQGGAPQSAQLVDWFEVVQPDGTPVTHPTYRVALVVQDRGGPAR